MNSFTVEEIKQSVDYQWRMHHIKTYMAIWGVIAVFSLLVTFFVTVGVDSRLRVIAFVDCGVKYDGYGGGCKNKNRRAGFSAYF